MDKPSFGEGILNHDEAYATAVVLREEAVCAGPRVASVAAGDFVLTDYTSTARDSQIPRLTATLNSRYF